MMSESGTRGILTESDKDWLRGDIEYEHRQTAADRRAQIRDRVAAALQDFALLSEQWSEDERQKMLEELEDPDQSTAEIIEFLYLALNERATDLEENTDGDTVDRALAFRRGLCSGIKNGKSHFGGVPNFVLIDANTDLFEVPSKEDLRQVIDTDQWREANEHVRGAFNTPDEGTIDKEEAAEEFHLGIHAGIEKKLYTRRGNANDEIKRHDQMIASSGPLPRGGDSLDE